MARKHGKLTIIKVGANDVSAYTNSSELTRSADTHDTTTYGNNSHRKDGGLLDGGFKASGFYDNTAVTGPRFAIMTGIGTTQSITRQVEGAGTGKPQEVFNGVLTSYVESNPVADMITWSAEWEIDGDVVTTAQA